MKNAALSPKVFASAGKLNYYAYFKENSPYHHHRGSTQSKFSDLESERSTQKEMYFPSIKNLQRNSTVSSLHPEGNPVKKGPKLGKKVRFNCLLKNNGFHRTPLKFLELECTIFNIQIKKSIMHSSPMQNSILTIIKLIQF